MGHENVDTFQSGMIVDEMFKAGYRHILVKVKPLDVGIPIGRPRRLLGNISILYTYIWIYIYICKYVQDEGPAPTFFLLTS